MDGLIIYDTKYGSTGTYARWLSDELGLPLRLAPDAHPSNFTRSDYVLIGTPVYFGRFRIRKWLHKYGKYLSGKKLFFFVVSGSKAGEEAERNRFVKNSIPRDLLASSEIHFLGGRLIHKDLSLLDRLAMKMGGRAEKDPVKKAEMLADHDDVKKENLIALVQSVNNFRSLTRKEVIQNYSLQ